MKTYRVKDWDKNFETCETRKLKNLDWWPHPNKHDGLGFRRLAQQRDKVELYCAWNLICDIASKGPKERRGLLMRDGKALMAPEMSLMTGFPESIFQKALSFFSDPSQAWLIAEEIGESPNGTAATEPVSGGAPGTPADSPRTPAGHDAEGREGEKGRKEGIEEKEGKESYPHTNAPTPEQAMAHFKKCSDYTESEVKAAWLAFQAGQQDGFWMWGKRRLGDWRAAMESRMAENREKKPTKKPESGSIQEKIKPKILS